MVELFESIPQADKEIPTSWAYTHTIISYIKDATGIFRRVLSDSKPWNIIRPWNIMKP